MKTNYKKSQSILDQLTKLQRPYARLLKSGKKTKADMMKKQIDALWREYNKESVREDVAEKMGWK